MLSVEHLLLYSSLTMTHPPFLNTCVTSACLSLFGKHFCVIIFLFQMSFNGGAQMSDIWFKRFAGMLP